MSLSLYVAMASLSYLPDKLLFILQNPTTNHGNTSIAPGGEGVWREEDEGKPKGLEEKM